MTARFCDTVLAVTHVAETYRIGTAPGVDLPLAADVTEFPIVSRDAKGFIVRRPIGLGALDVAPCPNFGQTKSQSDRLIAQHAQKVCRTDFSDEVRLAVDSVVTFAFERVTIEISLVEEQAPLALTKLDRRPWWYIASALLVHLCVWGAAITFAKPPPPKKSRPPWIAHPVVARLAPANPYQYEPHKLAPPTPQQPPLSAQQHPPTRDPHESAYASAANLRGGTAEDSGFGAFSPAFLEGLKRTDQAIRDALAAAGPLYNEYEVESFGGQRQFDPGKRAGWGTIATGRFKTISTGHAAGEDYRMRGEVRAGEAPANFAMCESPLCDVTGGLAKTDIEHTIEPVGLALANCVGDAALAIELDILPNGHIKRAHAHGKIGRCAANVIGHLAFPEADSPTHVVYTLGYP